jgi:hypothetical protein
MRKGIIVAEAVLWHAPHEPRTFPPRASALGGAKVKRVRRGHRRTATATLPRPGAEPPQAGRVVVVVGRPVEAPAPHRARAPVLEPLHLCLAQTPSAAR